MSRDSEIREPGHVPRLLHVKCDAGVRIPRLLAVAAVFDQPFADDGADALCADHARWAVATTRPKALHLCRVFRNNQGGPHGGTVTYTTGGRRQMPMG